VTAWTSDELSQIGSAGEVRIASLWRDGTLRRPVTVWVVPYGDGLYVRSVRGPDGAWFRGTQTEHEGRILAGRVERTKYRRYAGSILNSVLTPQARSTTTKLLPRSTTS
jgi:hypothetical protein